MYPIAEADNFAVRLKGDLGFGFARLTKSGGRWNFDTNYKVNLTHAVEPPKNLTVTAGTKAGLNWTASATSGVQYRVYRLCSARSSCGSWQLMVTTANPYWTDNSTLNSTDEFMYYVTAVDAAGWESPPSNEVHWTNGGGGTQPLLKAGPALPTEYALHAVYPNPARQEASIAYDLPEAADVTLTLYDVLGREVARPVGARQEPGFHRASLDASRLAPGVYVCRLTAGGFTATRSLVVTR